MMIRHMGVQREMTPPTIAVPSDGEALSCSIGSASTTVSCFPPNQDWSPESNTTTLTTPPRSPHRVRECGPLLLPRVRTQDQLLEPVMAAQVYHSHSRTASLPATTFPPQFGGQLVRPYSRAGIQKRSLSPNDRSGRIASLQPPSPLDHMINDTASISRKTSISHGRSVSTSSVRGHSRSTSSSSSIDANMLSRYGYPTYRQSPVPQPAGANPQVGHMSSAMSHLAPIPMPSGHVQSYPARTRSSSPQARPVTSPAITEQHDNAVADLRTATALEYLTGPNPTPALARRTVDAIRGQDTHFWYDVRNVRVWTDFNVATIAAIPDLLRLLQFPVPARELPTPSRVNLNPEHAAHLADLCASHHAVKVNAVLKLTQGRDKHMAMRALRSAPGARQQPEFVSSYQSDAEQTIYGDNRGRVVGIVKCYDQWNSGMRSGEAPDKVKYLRGLAHLHRFMREHGTRYGFIMTEIELVCIRAGGRASPTSNVPLFGYLEVAKPVNISSSGPGENGNLKMTAGLALWWLHTLAKEQPMPGQFHWRMDIGAPGARTRQFHLPRDDWMPKAIGMDTREAKRVRGWVWPHEPLSKRECGKIKKGKA